MTVSGSSATENYWGVFKIQTYGRWDMNYYCKIVKIAGEGNLTVKVFAFKNASNQICFVVGIKSSITSGLCEKNILDAQGTVLESVESIATNYLTVNQEDAVVDASGNVYTLKATKDFTNAYGTSRPSTPKIGDMFYDSSSGVNKPIWFNGTNWVDATGTPI